MNYIYMNIEIKKNNTKLNKIKKNSVIFKKYFEKYFKNIKNKKNIIPLNVRYIEIKNLDKFNYSKNYYNYSSNILYLLSYLNTINFIPDNMRIVCHSNIMNKLLKHIINNDMKNNIKKVENIKNENLWSLFMNLKGPPTYNSKINITRHGFSVANLYKEVQKEYVIQHGVYEKDAKLSMYGILSSLLHGDILVSNEKDMGLTSEPNIIYVSTLIRTWMTAICLYLPQFAKKEENNNFTLIVSPFIKEEGSINFIKKTEDNEPEKFDIQIKNILYFLHYLLNIYNNYNIKNNSDEIIKKNLEYIYKYFESENELIIMKGNIKYTIKCVKNEINRYLFKNSSNSDKNNFIAYYHKLEHNSLKETVKNNINNRNSNATTIESLNNKIKTYIIGNIFIFEGINKPFKEESNLKFPKESKDIIVSCEAFSKNFDSKESKYSCENLIYQ